MKTGARSGIVLDAWAMMVYLNDEEPAANEVRQALRRARKGKLRILFSIINYGECLYVIERRLGVLQAQKAIGAIDSLPLTVVPAERSLVFAASRLKARYSIFYADAFAAALAKTNDAALMTGDPEFTAVEPGIAIHWLPGGKRQGCETRCQKLFYLSQESQSRTTIFRSFTLRNLRPFFRPTRISGFGALREEPTIPICVRPERLLRKIITIRFRLKMENPTL